MDPGHPNMMGRRGDGTRQRQDGKDQGVHGYGGRSETGVRNLEDKQPTEMVTSWLTCVVLDASNI